jgi:hypothetical protein
MTRIKDAVVLLGIARDLLESEIAAREPRNADTLDLSDAVSDLGALMYTLESFTDSLAPESPADVTIDDDDYERGAEAAQRKRDAAEGFES